MHIITIDGPASSGKGTVAKLVAQRLNFSYLDSGAIYRALGLTLIENNLSCERVSLVLDMIQQMDLVFTNGKALINEHDKTKLLRGEKVGMMASNVAKIPEVRQSLLDFQRGFALKDNLVTDGRDMGSVVFPEATLKVFLTASAEKRANRRYLQLQELGNSVTIGAILRDIEQRDQQDSNRSVAPLGYDSTFRVLDNSELSVDETVQTIIDWYWQVI